MFDILSLIEGIASNVAHEVGGAISNVLSDVQRKYNDFVVKPISRDVTSTLGNISNALDQLEKEASAGILGVVNTLNQTLSTAESSIAMGFERGMGEIERAIVTISSDISRGLNMVVSGVERGFTAIESGVTSAFHIVANTLEKSIEYLAGKIVEGVTAVIFPFVHFIEGLPQDIETIATGVKTELEKVAGSVEKAAEIEKVKWDIAEKKNIEAVDKITSLKSIESGTYNLAPTMEKIVSELIGIDIAKVDKASFARLIAGLGLEVGVGMLANDLTGLEYMLSQQLPQLIQVALAGSWRDLNQAANAGNPNMLIGLVEAISGKYKGYITDDFFYDQAARSGFTKENADYMFKIADTILGLGELISLYFRGKLKSKEDLYTQAFKVRANKYQVDQSIALFEKLFGAGESIDFWRRGIMPEGYSDYFEDLAKIGYTPERIKAIKEVSYRLPSWKEQKEFGFRGLYDPDTIKKYQYDYKLDEKYYANAKSNGYDKETAKLLYESSWEVAPFFITEGLYRSGKLGADTFKELLLLDGYSPAWADIFIKEMAPTLTSGDIKNMYKFQLITADQIVDRLVGIGLAIPIAEEYKNLWMASIAMAPAIEQTTSQEEAGKIKGNTESLIKDAYKDKILSRNQALSDLKEIKMSNESAGLILSIIDYESEQQKIKDIFIVVMDELKARAITISKALIRLQAAGATAEQMVVFNEKLNKEITRKTKSPTLSEFKEWYKKGVINGDMLLEALRFLGYADTWIPFFLIEAGLPRKKIAILMTKTNNPLTP